jgi:hypothetical protein
MADRIKGFKISFYDDEIEPFELIRQYQDPEGWYITDAGLNEDETGYYIGASGTGTQWSSETCRHCCN